VTTLSVRAERGGERLDAFLAARPELPSRAAAQRLIDAGAVTVDGARRPRSWRLSAGELVEAELVEPSAVDAPEVPFEVVYEDDHLLVVDKPAGVVTHPAPGHRGPTIAEALAGRAAGGADPTRAGIVHRLDRDTSGLMVVARSPEVHTALQRMIRKREVERRYLALVNGHPDAAEGTIEAPIGRDRVRRTTVSTRTDKARPAVTHFRLLERYPRTALLEIRLESGRTHQIRAHFAAIGLPVCGDRQYGGGECGRRLGIERQWLHSAKLMFRHPISREEVACESKPPADLRRILVAAKREPVSGGPDGD
jgi:23S rRNA pseudouridine1911/1915/1917 synthase